jgi:hypothetical protein
MLIGGGVINTTLVCGRVSSVSTKCRMLVEKAGQGTSGSTSSRQASFAPRRIVTRIVGGADGRVARWMMWAKSGRRRVEV